MARKRKLSPEEEARIVEAHAQGLGIKKLVKRFGLAFSLVVRTLRRARPRKSLPGSPQLSLPVQQPREPGSLPLPNEVGATFADCMGCGKRAALGIAGLCRGCVASESQKYGSDPVGRGRCWRCNPAKHNVVLHMWTLGSGGQEGMCGLHAGQEIARALAQDWQRRQRPVPDSRGIVYLDGNPHSAR